MKKIIYTLLFASVLLMFVGCPNPTEQVVDPNLVKIDVPVEVSPLVGKMFYYELKNIDETKTYEFNFDLNKISSSLKADNLWFTFVRTDDVDTYFVLSKRVFSKKLTITAQELKKYDNILIFKAEEINLNEYIPSTLIATGKVLGGIN